jgi:hypothetical protein
VIAVIQINAPLTVGVMLPVSMVRKEENFPAMAFSSERSRKLKDYMVFLKNNSDWFSRRLTVKKGSQARTF